MSLRRIRAGEWLAGAAGTVLLVALLLPWYSPRDGSVSAWEAFSVTDVLLALLALTGPALLAVQATRVSPALPTGMGVITVVCAIVAVLVVLARLILQPGSNEVVGVEAGAWIGLAAALALLAGGWWSMAAEEDPGAPMPHVEVRPAPPATG